MEFLLHFLVFGLVATLILACVLRSAVSLFKDREKMMKELQGDEE